MASVEYAYSFYGRSVLDLEASQTAHLQLASTGDALGSRRFLDAKVMHPEVTAKALRLVSEVVAARYYIHPSMLARILREADPVATVSQSAVRFEGFSACCSTYIRLDMDNAALHTQCRSHGTTNVDFGEDMRAALAQIQAGSDMHLSIGADHVKVTHDDLSIVEKKVPLPLRWIKGFGEVQVHLSAMVPAFDLGRIAAQRFLRGLPRSKDDSLKHVSVQGGQARITARAARDSVPVRGIHRLALLEGLSAFADRLRVFVNPSHQSSTWVLDFGDQRLSLTLNAEPWRGFSGDGGLLFDLAGAQDAALAALRAQLNWQDGITPEALAAALDRDLQTVETGLAALAGQGLVGFDVISQTWFHRVLAFNAEKLVGLNPRLKSALALVAGDAVTQNADGSAQVSSKEVVHHVQEEGDQMTCTCPWFAKHKDTRGPCKHILAVHIKRGADQ